MNIAALTFVFNEKINLPIWIKYYGNVCGLQNLFIVDRMSTDNSTNDLGEINLIRIPRMPFDEHAKTDLLSAFHAGLTSTYDAVIVTDCDEIIVPDPDHFDGLADYIAKMAGDYANAIGIDVVHMIHEEMPLDLGRPILSQRSIGRFHAPECKHLISRKPIRWLPGLHSSDQRPDFDPQLFIFHLKLMDYGMSMARQAINLDTEWSKLSLMHNYGAHHRYTLSQFVKQNFLVPIDLKNRDLIKEFEFSTEISILLDGTVLDQNGFYRVPMDVWKMVFIPSRFSHLI